MIPACTLCGHDWIGLPCLKTADGFHVYADLIPDSDVERAAELARERGWKEIKA